MGFILGWFKALQKLRGGFPAWTWGLRKISQEKWGLEYRLYFVEKQTFQLIPCDDSENQLPLPLPGCVAAICWVTLWTNYIVCILCYVSHWSFCLIRVVGRWITREDFLKWCVCLEFGVHLQHSRVSCRDWGLSKFFLGLGTGLLVCVALQIPRNTQEDFLLTVLASLLFSPSWFHCLRH